MLLFWVYFSCLIVCHIVKRVLLHRLPFFLLYICVSSVLFKYLCTVLLLSIKILLTAVLPPIPPRLYFMLCLRRARVLTVQPYSHTKRKQHLKSDHWIILVELAKALDFKCATIYLSGESYCHCLCFAFTGQRASEIHPHCL